MTEEDVYRIIEQKDAELERKREEIRYQGKIVSGLEQKFYEAKVEIERLKKQLGECRAIAEQDLMEAGNEQQPSASL